MTEWGSIPSRSVLNFEIKCFGPSSLVLTLGLLVGCAPSSQFEVSRLSDLEFFLATDGTGKCDFGLIAPDVFNDLLARPDANHLLKKLDAACPGIVSAFREQGERGNGGGGTPGGSTPGGEETPGGGSTPEEGGGFGPGGNDDEL